jgi:hypothetical protein
MQPSRKRKRGDGNDDFGLCKAIADAEEVRGRAIAFTNSFDSALGLVQNKKKEQLWSGDETVEHLGLRLSGAGDAWPFPTEAAVPHEDKNL